MVLRFFILSVFSGLADQVVMLRVAMAAFSVTMPLISIVPASFIAGLAVENWDAEHLASPTLRRWASVEGLYPYV
jgi:hypothetical protein